MSTEALKELEIATCNMSVPVMVALLDRIHCRLQETGEMDDVAEHIGEALSLLFDKHGEDFEGLALSKRPH